MISKSFCNDHYIKYITTCFLATAIMSDFVYSAGMHYIIKMKKLPDTITNENRSGVIDKNCAIFRGNKFLVDSIYSKHDGSKIRAITCYFNSNNPITYVTGKVVYVKKFNLDLDYFFGDISFVLDETRALDYVKPTYYTGPYTIYHYNGFKLSEGLYKNGVPSGLWCEYYPNRIYFTNWINNHECDVHETVV